MINDTDTFEFQALNDFREARRRGFSIKESNPTRTAPRFGSYVVMPSMLFGFLAALASASTISLMSIFLSYYLDSVSRMTWVIVFCAIAAGSVVMAYTAVYMMLDWRSLQVKTTERNYLGDPKRETRARIMSRVAPGRHRITSLDWVIDWEQQLARRVYDERASWIAGDRVTRKLLAGLYPDLTGNYEIASEDLAEMGLINNSKDRVWTEKGRKELLDNLRIVYSG